MIKTVTFDTDKHKIVPLEPTDEIILPRAEYVYYIDTGVKVDEEYFQAGVDIMKADYKAFVKNAPECLGLGFNECPPPGTDLRTVAKAVYTPPFIYQHGRIYDSAQNLVADNDMMHNTSVVTRIRGWGRICYMKDAEFVQDEIGRIVAEALNKYWNEK